MSLIDTIIDMIKSLFTKNNQSCDTNEQVTKLTNPHGEPDVRILRVDVLSKKNQRGDSITKEWVSPFSCYIRGTYFEQNLVQSEFTDYNTFYCKVTNLDNPNAEFTLTGSYDKKGKEPMPVYILKGKMTTEVYFTLDVVTPGKYEAEVFYDTVDSEGKKVTFTIVP